MAESNKSNNQPIYRRSEEVQEVMQRIPSGIQRYGITVLGIIVLALLAGSYFFSYPDKVTATFILQSDNPPAYVGAGNSAAVIRRIEVYDGQQVKAGHLLAVLSQNNQEILLLAPASGRVRFMQPWKQNRRLEADETLMVIEPQTGTVPAGKALLPLSGIGRVQVGQRVIVRLTGFAQEQYGYLEGKVVFVSPIPDAKGMFALEISLPDGMLTNNRTELPFIDGMTGTAEIVTKERSLLERLVQRE